MSNKKVISMLESIPQYKSISKTNKIYSKTFKNYSLNHLIDNLKNIKIFHPKTILDKLNEEESKIKKLEDINNKNNFQMIDFLDSLTQKNKNLKNKKIIKPFFKKKNNNINNNDINFSSIIEYNPNYDSIYKKVYACRIAPLKPEENKKIKLIKKNKKLPHINSPKKISNSYSKKPLKTESSNDEDLFEKKLNFLPQIKNNHTLKFSDYSERIYPPKSESVDFISYIQPYNYLNNKKNIINFNNNSKRNDLINKNSLEIPPSSYYQPKYDYVEKHSSNCIFGIKKNNKKLHKKFLFKKSLADYNIDSSYHFIDNKKLNG